MQLRPTLILLMAIMFTVCTGEEEESELLSRNKPPTADHEAMENLKDMLVVSMQNIVSINDLVTQLTQKVVQNMLSVGESKTEIEVLKKSHSEEVAKLRKQIEDMKTELGSQIEDGDTELKSQIEEMGIDHNSTLVAMSEEIRGEISLISKDVTILNAEEGLRDQRCAKVCAGTTGRTSSSWTHYSSAGLRITVDISGCGFVTVPTITTSLEGSTSHWTTTGSSEIYSVTTGKFDIYIDAKSSTLRGASSGYGWNMEWIAVGYTC